MPMPKTTTPGYQMSFSQTEYCAKKKLTRRDIFLAKMELVVPWSRLIAVIEPHYPKSGKRGRPPLGIELMLRMYFIQQWYGLADVAVEDAIYDSQALRNFCGIDLAVASVPDSTTLMDFRHLLEMNALPQAMLKEVNALLKERGLLMSQGTLIDATLIAAPSSTKNKPHARDPEMHQAKKGNQWYFGMKAHIGADEQSGLVHTVVSTAANISDISQTANLMHGEETCVGADAGYVGAAKREEVQTKLQGKAHAFRWRIAKRRKPIKQMPECWQKDLALAYERLKASIRAKVEHPFHVVKNIFKYKKTRYKGIGKNDAQLNVLFALSNLYMVRGKLCPLQA
jgi:transposase, IS5 family